VEVSVRARPSGPSSPRPPRPRVVTLCLDVGGTWVKAARMRGSAGRPAVVRVPTPKPATPAAVLRAIREVAVGLAPFHRVAAGFPGVVRGGVVATAPNLAPGAWAGRDFRRDLERVLGRPARVSNDAVLHGLGAVRGRGVELLLTLGTGLGSVLFVDGRPVPLELGHLPWEGGRSYEGWLGEAARRRAGTRAWRARLERALAALRAAFGPDALYLGGGNAARLTTRPPVGAHLVRNEAALRGGVRLWERGVNATGR
jgi:polyphosphate glucokinase